MNEEVIKFYLRIIAELKELQTARLVKERALPLDVHVYNKFKTTWFATRKQKKKEKQRLKIEKGYHKAINDSIKRVEDIFKEILKSCSKD